jgi:hypothetical protein
MAWLNPSSTPSGVIIMALPTFSFPADAASGASAGDYVPAALAQQLEHTLSKLVWTVLYGKTHDASTLAVGAEQMLQGLKLPKAA